MVRTSTVAVGALGSLVAAVGAWNLYQRATTEQVPYTVVDSVGGVELRRYPETVLVETVAPSESAAFRRLFRYITGENVGTADVSTTAPVAVERPGAGQSIPMTAPVEVEKAGRGEPSAARGDAVASEQSGRVRMAFYLPELFDHGSAPRPTDDRVSLVTLPERTLAVRRFSWRPTDRRVADRSASLLAALDGSSLEVTGDPYFLGYDAPGTLPFLRRNEVAVEVERPRE